MSFLKPKVYVPPAPVAPPPPVQAGEEDTQRAAALSEEAVKKPVREKALGLLSLLALA